MLLAIDVGNTNIVFGVYDQDKWTQQWRIQTVHNRMPDEYAVLFQSLLDHDSGLHLASFEHVIISSVVPQLTSALVEMMHARSQRQPLVLSNAMNLGIEIATDNPERVGADIIADCVAAYERVKDSCIVVDFGTATTFTVVTNPGVMRGTAISAGLRITIDALVNQTAQLPQIEIAAPPSVIGTNTIASMQSGLVVGYVAMIEGMIQRMNQAIGDQLHVIATGGLSTVVAPLTDIFDNVDPWLTLEGLRLIAARNS